MNEVNNALVIVGLSTYSLNSAVEKAPYASIHTTTTVRFPKKKLFFQSNKSGVLQSYLPDGYIITEK